MPNQLHLKNVPCFNKLQQDVNHLKHTMTSLTSSIHSVLTKLLVGLDESHKELFEVVNLDGTSQTCDDPPNYPLQVTGATGQLFQGSVPIICGGVTETKFTDYCQCHTFIGGAWVEVQLVNFIEGAWSGDSAEWRQATDV